MTPETSQYLQSIFGRDEATIQIWFNAVCQAFPYLHEISNGFLVVAMGGLQSALEAGWSVEQWIVNTHKNNAHLLEQN